MDKLGIASHISGSRKIILRTNIWVRTGMQVYDEEVKVIGRIFDVFGPVVSPYVSIDPSVDKLDQYIGRSLYVLKRENKRR